LSHSLVPVLRGLGVFLNVEGESVHESHVSSAVPGDAGMAVLANQRVIIDHVLFHHREQGLVPAKGHAPELVVVPVLVKDVLDVTKLVSAESDTVLFCAILADEDPEPDEGVGSQVLFAVDAVFVVGVREFLCEIVLELLRLGDSAGLEVGRLHLLGLCLFLGFFAQVGRRLFGFHNI